MYLCIITSTYQSSSNSTEPPKVQCNNQHRARAETSVGHTQAGLQGAGSSLAGVDRTLQDTLAEGVEGTGLGILGEVGGRRLACRKRTGLWLPQAVGSHLEEDNCRAIQRSNHSETFCACIFITKSRIKDTR